MTAAIEPSITHVAVEQMPLTYRWYCDPVGRPINAASVLPNLLRDYGDLDEVLADIAPRKMLSAGGLGDFSRQVPTLQKADRLLTENPTAHGLAEVSSPHC